MQLKSKYIICFFFVFLLLFLLNILPILLSTQNCLAANIKEEEKLAVINRYHYDLYNEHNMKLFPSIITADIIDPITKKIIDSLCITDIKQRHQLYKFREWAYENICHTQSLEKFKDEKGKDPWGNIHLRPTYKKLISSEMKAMYIYSDKQMTGKCSSIVNLLVSMFRLMGVDSSNIIVLRIKGHSFGLVKIQGKLYLINNNAIRYINDKILNWIVNKTYYGLYNDKLSINKRFKINKKTLTAKGTLLDNIATANEWNIQKHLQITDDIIKYNLNKKEDLFNKDEFNNNKWLTLAKYAYQSLNIKDPEIYLKASLRGPIVKNLAKDIETINDIYKYMDKNLKEKSIFKYDSKRIMLADQLIVFKTGNAKDRGVLVYTLLKLKGYNPELILSKDNSYIRYNDKIIDIKNQRNIDKLNIGDSLNL